MKSTEPVSESPSVAVPFFCPKQMAEDGEKDRGICHIPSHLDVFNNERFNTFSEMHAL